MANGNLTPEPTSVRYSPRDAKSLAINVSTVPLVFLIGGGGRGELIFSGTALNEFGTMLSDGIPPALLAVLVDFLVTQLQRRTIPRGVNPRR